MWRSVGECLRSAVTKFEQIVTWIATDAASYVAVGRTMQVARMDRRFRVLDSCGQATKGTWGMSWCQKA